MEIETVFNKKYERNESKTNLKLNYEKNLLCLTLKNKQNCFYICWNQIKIDSIINENWNSF